jgi:hypothetical protein
VAACCPVHTVDGHAATESRCLPSATVIYMACDGIVARGSSLRERKQVCLSQQERDRASKSRLPRLVDRGDTELSKCRAFLPYLPSCKILTPYPILALGQKGRQVKLHDKSS